MSRKPYNYGRQDNWNREHNMTTAFGMRIEGLAYDESLAGPDGMHYHFWVPKGTTPAQVRKIALRLMSSQDVVSYSWDFEREKAA
jgi:hypothetical protein